MRQSLLNLSLAKPRQDVAEILKTYELFICGDVNYTSISSFENVLKIATTQPGTLLVFLIIFSLECEFNFFYDIYIILNICLWYITCLQLTIDTTKEEKDTTIIIPYIRSGLDFVRQISNKTSVTLKFCRDNYNYTQIFRILQ